ncbi:MAG: hypothetical protein QOF62_145 [Pyrinomonadaceae bacterium]|nr:hypothetical protein [Pyrinomonadaceae bacterium]
MKRTATHLLMIMLLVSPMSVGAKNVPLRYTRRLPPVDRVELQKVQPSELGIKAVEAVKILEGREAAAVAALWRTQNFRSSSADCHQPPFAIKFYSHGKLLLYASLCWECDNIDFPEPGNLGSQGFRGSSRKGQELLNMLRKSFP